MRNLASNLFSIAVAVAALAALGAAGVRSVFHGEGPLTQEIVYVVPKGAGLRTIADGLEAEGVVVDAWLFAASARYFGVAGGLKAGEYAFEPGEAMVSILEKLSDGQSVQHKVRAPEGLTSAQVVGILNESAVLTGEIEEIPPEGSLAPNTYFVRRGESRAAVLARMRSAQTKTLDELWAARAEGLPIDTKDEALIMASIIEKETGVSGERAQVASVFYNRLRRGMRLQTDPTVIYGITLGAGPLGRPLSRADLRGRTPYNTYVINGLPPTPIANPGRASIEAALNPASTEYYYFVADGTGGHAFSRTLDEHNAAVRRWRKIEAERRRAAQTQ